ncbi:MAG: ATP-grasp domain-containing protein [Deltaproteobacteria bacterium]|nr:ATP-grasp domain-containing protein [Deltaproteobacteria bacterium]
MTRVLVTGAGGPAAVCFMNAVARGAPDVVVHAADADPNAGGLYLVPEHQRWIVPMAREFEFLSEMLEICRTQSIDLLVPTVDDELLRLAAAVGLFRNIGTEVLVSPVPALKLCLDRWHLIQRMRSEVAVPWTTLLEESTRPDELTFPLFAKPRRGSGSRGTRQLNAPHDLEGLPRDGSYLLQQLLPGAEYSVDVCLRRDKTLVAAVPRERLKINSGVTVASQTLVDPQLQRAAECAARAAGVRHTANVQFKRDALGTPRLLEINPRFPGCMSLTVAAGVNMPVLCLREALGQVPPDCDGTFNELVMTRTFAEVFVAPEALGHVHATAPSATQWLERRF